MKAGEYMVSGVEKKQLEHTQIVQISNWGVTKYLVNFVSETKISQKVPQGLIFVPFAPIFNN